MPEVELKLTGLLKQVEKTGQMFRVLKKASKNSPIFKPFFPHQRSWPI
jgi:hypothetical protein